jgi:hypothetical protein
VTRQILSRFTTGVAAIETLLAAPVVLLLGLAALQWGLVFHAHQAISHAAHQGARAGSLAQASPDAIEQGLADGLSPWLFGSSGPQDHQENLSRSRLALRHGIAQGWIRWRQLSPGTLSFADWAVQARDAMGEPVVGAREIPNDNLGFSLLSATPASGIAGYRHGAPVGVASGQTLADANLLKIEFVYGAPLTVPLVGRLAAWIMRAFDRCAGAQESPPRLGLLDFGRASAMQTAAAAQEAPSSWRCAFYQGSDTQGRMQARWPIKLAATIRMQSPARQAGQESTAIEAAWRGASLGAGVVDPSSSFAPVPVAELNPHAASPSEDGSFDRAPGFLKIGGQRLSPPPPMCTGP